MEKYFFPLDENAGEIEVGVYLEKKIANCSFSSKIRCNFKFFRFLHNLKQSFFPKPTNLW